MTARKSKVKINIEFPAPPENPRRWLKIPYWVKIERKQKHIHVWCWRVDRGGFVYNFGIWATFVTSLSLYSTSYNWWVWARAPLLVSYVACMFIFVTILAEWQQKYR